MEFPFANLAENILQNEEKYSSITNILSFNISKGYQLGGIDFVDDRYSKKFEYARCPSI